MIFIHLIVSFIALRIINIKVIGIIILFWHLHILTMRFNLLLFYLYIFNRTVITLPYRMYLCMLQNICIAYYLSYLKSVSYFFFFCKVYIHQTFKFFAIFYLYISSFEIYLACLSVTYCQMQFSLGIFYIHLHSCKFFFFSTIFYGKFSYNEILFENIYEENNFINIFK